MTIYSIDEAQFQGIVTTAYESTILGLAAAGEITPEHANRILSTYAMMRFRKGWFGRAVDALLGQDATDSTWNAKLVAVKLRARPTQDGSA